jgi:GH15 family glucan-1,4-alpha-glucosidase
VVGTVEAIVAGLDDHGLLRRYDGDDGLPGREGAFLPGCFWLVRCLADMGRHEEAQAAFDRALAAANDLGLLAEEADAATGALLGNFPQALSHLAHVEAALALARGKPDGT